MAFSVIARSISVALSLYFLLCSLRIFMSWLPGLSTGRTGGFLRALTDPYLGFFSRWKVFTAGRLDFSPIAALALLSVLINAFSMIAVTGKISLGIVLSIILQTLCSTLGFFLLFFAASVLLRLVAYAARLNSLHPFWMALDNLLNPLIYRINRLLYRRRIVNYLYGLISALVVLLLAWKGLDLLARYLGGLLFRLPI